MTVLDTVDLWRPCFAAVAAPDAVDFGWSLYADAAAPLALDFCCCEFLAPLPDNVLLMLWIWACSLFAVVAACLALDLRHTCLAMLLLPLLLLWILGALASLQWLLLMLWILGALYLDFPTITPKRNPIDLACNWKPTVVYVMPHCCYSFHIASTVVTVRYAPLWVQ